MEIYVNKKGRLGNNLFQYFFAKILSEKIPSQIFISFDPPSKLDICSQKFTNPPENCSILEERWVGYKSCLYLDSAQIDEDLKLIIEKIKERKCNKLLIDGYFQQFSYYLESREEIKKSFDFKFITEEKTLGIHVRKGDIENTLNDLPDEWFIKMMQKYPNHKKYVTTDDPDSEIVKILQGMGCFLYQKDPMETILEFSNFSDLILSQGTFSWWMAFLSDGEKNFIVPKKGWNSENSSIKLLPNNKGWNYYSLTSGLEELKIIKI